MTLHDTVWILR